MGGTVKNKTKFYCNRSGIRIPQSFSDLTVRKIQPPLTRGLNRTEFTESPPLSPSSVRFADTVTLAVPEKIFGLTLILDFFDRGAIKSSLYRPQDALGFYAPKGEG